MLSNDSSKCGGSDSLAAELLSVLKLWRIWLRIGLQDIRMRYRRSSIGAAWIFINLFLMIIAVGFIYSKLLNQDIKTFIPFLTTGIIVWGYLTSSIVEGANAFVSSEGYIKQIGLPNLIYIFRSFISITVTMLLGLLAYPLIAFFYAVPFRLGVLWSIPGLILLCIVCFLFIVIFSHINTQYRDIGHIASIFLQIMFYVTPIIWPADLLKSLQLHWVVDFNPFYHFIEIFRRPLLTSEPGSPFNYLAVLICILLLSFIALIIVKRMNRKIPYML